MIMNVWKAVLGRRCRQSMFRDAATCGKALQTGLAACIFAFLFVPAVFAAQKEVGAGQTYATMQACMNAAASGDVCNVHAGTYAENVTFKTNGVTLQVNSGDKVTVNGTIDMLSFS